MKKVFIALSIILVAFISFLIYSSVFFINDDEKQLQENIKKFINRPTVFVDHIEIKQAINIDNKKYVLFLIKDTMGFADLTKGLNNKYKIESVEYGTGLFSDYIYKTNKGKYLIIRGKNYDMKINYFTLLLENKQYKINIPKKEYFLAYCKVPNEVQSVIPDFNNYKIYDDNEADITEEMFKLLLSH